MEKSKQEMRKRNMKIFPIYKKLSWDFLFYYTIDFIFLTQVKNISPADVVLTGSAYSFFTIIMQIPANIIIEFLGRKNSLVLGNILNCIYMVMIMLSKNLADLIFANFICALAFSIKNITEPTLLNESIPASRYKGDIYSKIDSKGASGYYVLNAISKIIAGYLFIINPYLPLELSLTVLVITVIISIFFVEPVKKEKRSLKEVIGTKQFKEIKEGFAFIIKSERLKALILCVTLIASLLNVLMSCYTTMFENLELTSATIGIIAAVGSLISSFISKKQQVFQDKFKNKTLITMALILSVSTIVAGLSRLIPNILIITVLIVVICFILYQLVNGIYYTLINKYLRNFTNEKIDTKIYSVSKLSESIGRVITGLFVAFLLDKTKISVCLIILGLAFTIMYILMGKYMKTRVGLKPEEYSKQERKYDEQI